jgi:hypothetical protein
MAGGGSNFSGRTLAWPFPAEAFSVPIESEQRLLLLVSTRFLGQRTGHHPAIQLQGGLSPENALKNFS